MNRRMSSMLPWLLLALTTILGGVALFFLLANQQGPGQEPVESLYHDIITLFTAITIAAIGALIVLRRRRHPIGWLLLGVGLSQAAQETFVGYSVYGLVTQPGALPGGLIFAWLQQWAWTPQFAGWLFLLLLYPTGHLLSRRWRFVGGAGTAGVAALILSFALTGELFVGNGKTPLTLRNPIGVIEMDISQPPILLNLLYLFVVVMLLAALISLVLRFRRAQGDERQQLKWVTYAAAPAVALAIASFFIPSASWLGLVQDIATLMVPLAIGVAILKYRLYDIDIIIRRTLIYAVLTVILVLVYFGSVVLLQQLLVQITREQQNEIVTVVSTLVIAALFVPLRRRIQGLIDRRFYRRKYDAQQVLAEFGVAARDETDLSQLAARLIEVVDETMQPDKVSLWLREPNAKTSRH